MNLKLLLTAVLSTAASSTAASKAASKPRKPVSAANHTAEPPLPTKAAISACAARIRLAAERILFGKSNKTPLSAKAAPSAKIGANVEIILAVKGKIG